MREILVLLVIGFSVLLFSSYNNRFGIAGVNRIVIAVCLCLLLLPF
jgi:predicted RND superfamily exporter protein